MQTITKKEFFKSLLQMKADALNAGYGEEIVRVVFCEASGEFVLEQKTGRNKWICLHE